jgi:hypothetical protein
MAHAWGWGCNSRNRSLWHKLAWAGLGRKGNLGGLGEWAEGGGARAREDYVDWAGLCPGWPPRGTLSFLALRHRPS